jgi:hypothetical protein
MKKISILTAALIALFAFTAAVAGAAKGDTKKFDSTITVKYSEGGSTDPYDPYTEAAFKGKVESEKQACVVNRKVKVKSKDGLGTVGSDDTNDDGRYRVEAAGFGPGDYKAKVVTKVIKKKNGGKIVCKSAKADITVE